MPPFRAGKSATAPTAPCSRAILPTMTPSRASAGILVVHEWWGHNEYARKRARMLAERGYTALALDMYGDGKQAHHPDDAQKFSSEVNQNEKLAKARFDAALALIKKEKT